MIFDSFIAALQACMNAHTRSSRTLTHLPTLSKHTFLYMLLHIFHSPTSDELQADAWLRLDEPSSMLLYTGTS